MKTLTKSVGEVSFDTDLVAVKRLMTYLESVNETAVISNGFTNKVNKIGLYMEASVEEYKINLDECELKVLKENGTYADLAYLKEEAENGLVDRAKKAIEGIIQSFKEFIQKIKDRIIDFFSKSGDGIDELEKKIKFNPILARKKVQIEDVDKQVKVFDAFADKLHGLVAKIKVGQANKSDVDDLENDYESKTKAAIIASLVTVTVASAIATLKQYSKKAADTVDVCSKETIEMLQGLAKNMGDSAHSSLVEAGQACARLDARISRDKVNTISQAPGKVMSAIKSAVGGNKGTKLTPPGADEAKVKTESADFMDDAQYLQNLHDQLFGESVSDDYTNDYMKEMENLVFGGQL